MVPLQAPSDSDDYFFDYIFAITNLKISNFLMQVLKFC